MGFNVLVVDDSDVIRAMIAKTLRLAKIPVSTIVEASNGREALSVLKSEWIDLVLADINMPVMNGVEMLERMRIDAELADIPVIVVSTEGANERVKELLGNGVTAWIRKPFTPEAIRDTMAGLMPLWPGEDERQAHVDAVLGQVLETFAFVFPEPVEPAMLPVPTEELVCATITFSGAAAGTMSLAAPAALCRELAANILGVDAEDEDARVRGADTLGEIANIAAGHLATRLEPDRATDLHPPVVSRIDVSEWNELVAAGAACTYLVEERPVLVTLGLRPLKVAC